MCEEVKARIRGLILNQPTPYKLETYEIDYEGLRANIEHWIENRVPVILLTFGTSDFAALSDREIYDLTRFTVETVSKRALVIACTNMWWLGESIKFAAFCKEIGADALMVPKHEPANATPDDIYRFYSAIAGASDIPLLYHSFLVGPKSIEVLKRVAEIPSVIAMKQETGDYGQYSLLRDAIGGRLAVVTSSGGELAYHAHQFGVAGSLTGTGQWAPGPAVRFAEQLMAGELDKAREHLHRILPYRRKAAALPNNIVAMKYAMDLAGLAGGPPRPPLAAPLTGEQKAEFAEVVYGTGLISPA